MNKLEAIKRELGSSCTHISSIKTKIKNADGDWVNVDGIKANILNKDGGKDKVEIILPVKFEAMQDSNFEEILNYIRNKEYVREKTV